MLKTETFDVLRVVLLGMTVSIAGRIKPSLKIVFKLIDGSKSQVDIAHTIAMASAGDRIDLHYNGDTIIGVTLYLVEAGQILGQIDSGRSFNHAIDLDGSKSIDTALPSASVSLAPPVPALPVAHTPLAAPIVALARAATATAAAAEPTADEWVKASLLATPMITRLTQGANTKDEEQAELVSLAYQASLASPMVAHLVGTMLRTQVKAVAYWNAQQWEHLLALVPNAIDPAMRAKVVKAFAYVNL